MTEQELREIEDTANAVTPNPGHLITVLAHKDIPALVAEVRRLRDLILDADGMAIAFGPNGDTATACPWCFGGRLIKNEPVEG